ncbi:hypothetical protein ACVINU_005761 [Bradyrhizobium diazoefficiens]
MQELIVVISFRRDPFAMNIEPPACEPGKEVF